MPGSSIRCVPRWGGAAPLASENASAVDHKRLKSTVAQLTGAVKEKRLKDVTDIDFRLHWQIVERATDASPSITARSCGRCTSTWCNPAFSQRTMRPLEGSTVLTTEEEAAVVVA